MNKAVRPDSFQQNSRASNKPKILVLVGPTASGKTAVALEVAKQLSVEIISADSRQVYKHMDIGTAKPNPNERLIVPHYFIDENLPNEDFNAGEFGSKGREIIEQVLQRGRIPLVVGGSGLYIRSLIDGFFEGPSANAELRFRLEDRMDREGAEALLSELRKVDPLSASKMLPGNRHRIIRALEVYYLTGAPISHLHRQKMEISFDPIFVGLEWDRKVLYDRINRRVDVMLEEGLVEEVKHLRQMGYSRNLNALLTTGYLEVFDYLDGKISEEEMIRLIKRNTRRYAKRQLTWFRPDERIRWYPVASEKDFSAIASRIVTHFKKNSTA